MNQITLYNTYSRRLENFKPLASGEVKMYTCGPTVYNYAHIGNLRTYISEDILEKSLLAFGYKVNRVMNITDVGHLESDADEGDDKMLAGARRENKTVYQIADYYKNAFFEDCKKLNIKKSGTVVNATDCIDDYINFIKVLEEKGFTYYKNGNVYFDISKFPDYTKLNRFNLDDLITGSRDGVTADEGKKNPQDFVLWFTKSKFEHQAMKWQSPWGEGYPGWHIECSAIAHKYLGDSLDIHCGGVDHINIHHTNEIAQTESFSGKKWVNYWFHCEFLTMDRSKMSKSSGEFLTLALLESKGYNPLAYRYYCLGSHYRMQLAFSYDNLDQAQNAYNKLRRRCAALKADLNPKDALPSSKNIFLDQFYSALKNDLNTANAITQIYSVLKSDLSTCQKVATIEKMDEILSLDLFALTQKSEPELSEDNYDAIQKLVDERAEAKSSKDYVRADKIRTKLEEMGIELSDTAESTIWSKSN